MKVNGITDVFFDLDHTLWDFDKNSALTFTNIFELNSIDVEVNDFLFHYEPINLNYWKLYVMTKLRDKRLAIWKETNLLYANTQYLIPNT